MGALPDKKHALQLSTALITSKEIKSVLVMGLGTGSYIRYMLENNYIEKVIVVDWSSETHEILVELENNKVLGSTFSDDRVRFINGDARVMSLALKEEKFDLIIDNLVYPTWVGATGVRTPYYFKNIANLLNKDGYFALTTNYARYRNNIISGLFDVFDYVYENKEGFILLSANSEIPFKKDLKNDYNLSHHKDTLLTKSEYDEILLNGFEYLDSKDFEEYKSLSESFLFSEFYLLSIKN
jgi:spermidine synthase